MLYPDIKWNLSSHTIFVRQADPYSQCCYLLCNLELNILDTYKDCMKDNRTHFHTLYKSIPLLSPTHRKDRNCSSDTTHKPKLSHLLDSYNSSSSDCPLPSALPLPALPREKQTAQPAYLEQFPWVNSPQRAGTRKGSNPPTSHTSLQFIHNKQGVKLGGFLEPTLRSLFIKEVKSTYEE